MEEVVNYTQIKIDGEDYSLPYIYHQEHGVYTTPESDTIEALTLEELRKDYLIDTLVNKFDAPAQIFGECWDEWDVEDAYVRYNIWINKDDYYED